MSLKTILAILICIPLALVLAQDEERAIYAGCFDREAILKGAVGIYLYDRPIVPEVPCNCGAIGYRYQWQWSQYGGVGTRDTCFCTNTTPSFRYFVNKEDYCTYAGMLYPSDSAVYAVTPAINRWSLKDCVIAKTPAAGFDVTDIYQCLNTCESSKHPYAALITHRRSATATCICLENMNVPGNQGSDGCGWERWQVFSKRT